MSTGFTKKALRSLILEEVEELFSQGRDRVSRLSEDSLDDQVDAFILKYENDSIVDNIEEDTISESLTNLSLSALILEQDEDDEPDVDLGPPPDEPPADEPDAAPGDEPPAADDAGEEDAPEPTGSEKMNPDVEPVASIPKLPLDVDAFTKRIARLAMNYDTLLDVRATIVNRAMSFLLENYDQKHADEMREILDEEYDFQLGKDSREPQDHFAVGAWAGGTGGPGGGG